MPLETFRWFAMLRYEFVVLLMMTSFLLVKGLRIAMMYQGVNVEGLEAYVPLHLYAQIQYRPCAGDVDGVSLP
ncbi:MAG: hypothetical protein V9G16_00455 [Nitrosomonas sp.]